MSLIDWSARPANLDLAWVKVSISAQQDPQQPLNVFGQAITGCQSAPEPNAQPSMPAYEFS